MAGVCSLDREPRNTSQRATGRKTWTQLRGLLRKPLPCPSKTSIKYLPGQTYGNTLACTSLQDNKPKEEDPGPVPPPRCSQDFVTPRETNTQIKPRSPQQGSLLPAVTNSIKPVFHTSLRPEQNASCFMSPGSYSKPMLQSCTHVIHQLYHSPFKPANSSTQLTSSHQERVVTMGPPQTAATSTHCLLSPPKPNICTHFVESRGQPTDFPRLH